MRSWGSHYWVEKPIVRAGHRVGIRIYPAVRLHTHHSSTVFIVLCYIVLPYFTVLGSNQYFILAWILSAEAHMFYVWVVDPVIVVKAQGWNIKTLLSGIDKGSIVCCWGCGSPQGFPPGGLEADCMDECGHVASAGDYISLLLPLRTARGAKYMWIWNALTLFGLRLLSERRPRACSAVNV